MKKILFFADKSDIINILSELECLFELSYTRMGSFEKRDIKIYNSCKDIDNFGIAEFEQSVACYSYLVGSRATDFVGENVSHNGIERVAFTPKMNDHTIVVRPGGNWEDFAIISGEVSSVHDSDFTNELMKVLSSKFRKKFKKIKAFWVGEGAYQGLKSGVRLTTAIQSPRDYDLSVE